jgi:hypothetical protein
MKARTTVILFGVFIILLVFVYLFEGPLSERKQKEGKGRIALFPDFNKNKATKITVKSKSQEISLKKSGKDWPISDTDGFTADPKLINGALDTVINFNRENIASKNPEKQELFEVVPGKGVEVNISDAGQKMLAHFYIGKTGPDFFSIYLRKEGSDEVLLTAGLIKSAFDKSVKDWRDKTIFSFPPDTITQLTLKTSLEEIVLKKDENGNWQITSPEQVKAKKEAVTDIGLTLASLKAIDFAENYNLDEHQLDKPQITITAILDEKAEKKLLIGKENEEKSQYYVKSQAKKTIFLVGKYQFDKFNKTLQDLKEEEKNVDGEKPAPKKEKAQDKKEDQAP